MKKLEVIENVSIEPSKTNDFTKLVELVRKHDGNMYRLSKNEATHLTHIDFDQPYPIILLDGIVVQIGAYPNLKQVQDWLGIKIEEKAACCGGCGG